MKRRDHIKVNIKGVVIAVSHMLLAKEPAFYIRIRQTSNTLCIRVNLKEHFQWLTFLKVGVAYSFSNVIPKERKLGIDKVQYCESSPVSQVREMLLALPESWQDICSAAVSYTGTVTDDSLSNLGLYKLHQDSMLCTSFIADKACIESFKCMDSVTIYNAHSRNIDGVTYYTMCAGSCAVSQSGNMLEPKNLSSLHPIIHFVLEKGLNFDDFLWLTKIYLKLKKLLDIMLLSGNKLHWNYVFDFLSNLMFSNPEESTFTVPSRDFTMMKEFLLIDHKCAPLCPRRHPDLQIIMNEECHSWSTKKETSEKFWSYELRQTGNSGNIDTKCAIIGRLIIEKDIPCLTLSDGVTPIRCILIGAFDCCSCIKSYVNKVVMVRMPNVVVERFRLPAAVNSVSLEKNYVYILLSPRDIHPLCDSLENITALPLNSDNNSKSLNARKSDDSEVSSVESDVLSQRLVMHHVSTPAIFEKEKQFFCLVSLLGHPLESSNYSDSIIEKSDERRRLRLLCMKGSMLKYYPLLVENRVYEIKYPSSCGMHLFDKRTNFRILSTAAVFLPFTEGVIIPGHCSIAGPFPAPNLPDDSLLDKEVYRIRDAPKVAFEDVVHLQGVLVLRSHQPAKYPHKYQANDRNYGVPEDKNIILELRDEECDETIRIYLILYSYKLYPLGLLPGSLVRIKFVKKKISKNSMHFYQSTCFTSIHVLKCPQGTLSRGHQNENICTWSRNSLDSSKRHSYIAKEAGASCNLQSPFWGIFSISKMWKFEVLPLCKSCKSQIRCGRCTYVGCSNLFKDPLIMANANFLVEDGSGEAYMSAKNENVRKLFGFSESEWKDLGVAATKNELIFDFKKYSQGLDQQSSKRSREDVNLDVFNRLFTEVELKPWHILCKKFGDEGDGKTLKLFCLDVQEIDLARAESLA